ncbi:hypothetical protein SAMD00019534_010960 [Acytostelium subglobosum LB1]|uniref:hypothetical protein n=1 Tax=Acytostelium subglobosum LB1 TaxID=1410327 RepID=UPI00064520A9|nr:hypothetical protein SAMD00019534_010960 [Acytostelium subglobosum LB1]GAM17921.1 hypothetical protein SAMD00019534_010960 [Acytostelium subglobosum LB1]|eukprot:XP_012758517.1 hypothetical protein SAMD00019534_010960 [Acytostelium subglobosum LB1]
MISIIDSSIDVSKTSEISDDARFTLSSSKIGGQGWISVRGNTIYNAVGSIIEVQSSLQVIESASFVLSPDSTLNIRGHVIFGSNNTASIGTLTNTGLLSIYNQYLNIGTLQINDQGTITLSVSSTNSTYVNVTSKATLGNNALTVRVASYLKNVNFTLVTLPVGTNLESDVLKGVKFSSYDLESGDDVKDIPSSNYRAELIGNDLVVFIGNGDRTTPSTGSKLSNGAIAGIVVGGVVALALLIALTIIIIKKRKSTSSSKSRRSKSDEGTAQLSNMKP